MACPLMACPLMACLLMACPLMAYPLTACPCQMGFPHLHSHHMGYPLGVLMDFTTLMIGKWKCLLFIKLTLSIHFRGLPAPPEFLGLFPPAWDPSLGPPPPEFFDSLRPSTPVRVSRSRSRTRSRSRSYSSGELTDFC